jgi:hypothetical protein
VAKTVTVKYRAVVLSRGRVKGCRIVERVPQVDPGEDQKVKRNEDCQGLGGTEDGVLRLDDGR